jgi:hypothetical protein
MGYDGCPVSCLPRSVGPCDAFGKTKACQVFRCEGDGNCAPSSKQITIGRQAYEAIMMKVASMP